MRRRVRYWRAAALATALGLPSSALGDGPVAPPPPVDRADTAFVLVAAAMAMLTIPALGLFFGGMVRRKNVLATFGQCFLSLALVAVLWALLGYSLAFAPDAAGGLVGGLDWAALSGVGLEASARATPGAAIPHQLHMAYHLMPAALAAALLAGASAERMRFPAALLFAGLWSLVVYAPLAHWAWSPDGWIARFGAIDAAGGLVVHVAAGASALALAAAVGRRRGLGQEEMAPHNLTLTAAGTGLLWFGWLGLVAGSTLSAGAGAAAAFVATNLAASAGALAWAAIEWFHKGKATVLGGCSGAIAGLVAISAGAPFVLPLDALIVGGAAGVLCYGGILLKGRLGYDDALDVFALHGLGGAAGVLLVGFQARADHSGMGNPGGVFDGHANQLGYQAQALAAVGIYALAASFALLKLLDRVVGLRAEPEAEELGLDLAVHGERGYISGIGELMSGRTLEGPDSPARAGRSGPLKR